jgi:hypothetical protein
MKKLKLTLSIVMPLIGIISLIVFPPWLLVKAWVMPKKGNIQLQIEEAINYKLDGVLVYVDQGGKAPAYYTSGWNNREKKIPVKPNDLFKIASI